MRWAKLLAVVLAFALIACCFFPWVTVESRAIVVSGTKAEGTPFGRPGYLHMLFAVVYILMVLWGRNWNKQVAVFLCALNIAWALRNYFLLTACRMGECPVKHFAVYAIVFFSIAMLVVLPFVPVKKNAVETAPPSQSESV